MLRNELEILKNGILAGIPQFNGQGYLNLDSGKETELLSLTDDKVNYFIIEYEGEPKCDIASDGRLLEIVGVYTLYVSASGYDVGSMLLRLLSYLVLNCGDIRIKEVSRDANYTYQKNTGELLQTDLNLGFITFEMKKTTQPNYSCIELQCDGC